MAGKDGYTHSCSETKIDISTFKKSILDSGFTSDEIAMVWDFYVTKSFAATTGLSVSLKDYGWSSTPKGPKGHMELENQLKSSAALNDFCTIKSKTIKDTLSAMNLSDSMICISHPRAVLMQDYSVSVDENENLTFSNEEGRLKCLFRHIRNAMAHGNTYFFDNGMVLLKDYSGNSTCTASILIPKQALIDWIGIVDFSHKYYGMVDEETEGEKEE